MIDTLKEIEGVLSEALNTDALGYVNPETGVNHLVQEALRLAREGGWISVEDRLPERYTDVLCHFDNDMDVNGYAVVFLPEKCWRDHYGEEVHTITHWQPLPEPPEDK